MSDVIELLGWLERWYQAQCDDEWEHHYGVTIQTLDNPGWLVQADLRGVELAAIATDQILAVVGEPPSEKNGNIGGNVWMKCEIKSGKFVGAGDPTQLRMILAQFRSLVERKAPDHE
jgi:hypothetical protein